MEHRVKKHLCRVYALSLDDVGELFEIGRETVLESLERLERAIAERDLAEAREVGHMLKGTLFNMGLDEVAEMAKELEAKGKNGDMADTAAIFAAVRRTLNEFARTDE